MTAIIYARVSSASDRQSTARQIEDLTAYANGMGYELASVFEEHISGAIANHERPVLQLALRYAKDKHIDIVLVSELSRLGRNVFEILETIKQLRDAKINLYIQKEQFTLLDSDGHPAIFAPILIATLATCAEIERQNISYRLNSGRAKYIADGGKLGRPKGTNLGDLALIEKHKPIKKLLTSKNPPSLRQIAILTNSSLSTVQRVKRAINASRKIKPGGELETDEEVLDRRQLRLFDNPESSPK